MSARFAIWLSLGMLLPATDTATPLPAEPARLRELLHDRRQPRNQSQAALLLVQHRSPEAEAIVRQGLRDVDTSEVFLALAAALRLCPDSRYAQELLTALAGDRLAIRQAAAETLAVMADDGVVLRLKTLAQDARADLAVRQIALWTLGRSGRQESAAALIEQLSHDNDTLRRAAADALTDLTGLTYGPDPTRWRDWWERHKDQSNEHWLAERLAYQTSRTHRLESDLERTKAHVVRLHQQLYSRLPAADRLNHILAVADQDDPPLRNLAVSWSLELLPIVDAPGQQKLADALLRLSRDGTVEVQRSAVLALGRVNDLRAFEQLRTLLRQGPVPVRAAAARALAQQARGSGPEAQARQGQVVPALQQALDDPALEVVVEAAEDLGALGVPEAGPVLAALLRHRSEPVRQTAALALERIADAALLDRLLEVPDDTAATVRFSWIGALGRAAGDGRSLSEAQRTKLLARLEALLLRDTDPGVRSRAATVLGECASATLLPTLWRRVLTAEDSRVQEKAWAALLEIIARTANLDLLYEWDRILTEANQGLRRVQLLNELASRWQKSEETKALAGAVLDALVQAQLEQGKWTAAFPHVRELLTRPGSDAEVDKRLRWLLTVGSQALKEGNRAEALRVVQEAQTYLVRNRNLAAEFENLEKQARQER